MTHYRISSLQDLVESTWCSTFSEIFSAIEGDLGQRLSLQHENNLTKNDEFSQKERFSQENQAVTLK